RVSLRTRSHAGDVRRGNPGDAREPNFQTPVRSNGSGGKHYQNQLKGKGVRSNAPRFSSRKADEHTAGKKSYLYGVKRSPAWDEPEKCGRSNMRELNPISSPARRESRAACHLVHSSRAQA